MTAIIIIDNRPALRMSVCQAIGRTDKVTLWEAGDGVQGLEIIRDERPDLAIVRALLPGMDGYAICRAVRADAALSEIPLLLVVGSDELQEKLSGLEAGANDFIQEPWRESELQARVYQLLHGQTKDARFRSALKVRDELVNMLMHDVGNMVSSIRSALSLFQVLPPDSADALRYVDEAYESTEVLGGIISDALNMSKLESQNIRLRRKETNLETLVEGLLRASRGLADERQISLGLLVDDPAAATGYVDPTLMRRIAANLLLNAIRYAPESTSVTVRLSRGDGSGGVRLSVIDEGPGLSEEQQARMFDKIGVARHFAEHHEHLGYGLGLAFCKMAVQAHHGILAVQSAPGKGSTFTVEIPGLSDAERAAQDY